MYAAALLGLVLIAGIWWHRNRFAYRRFLASQAK